MSFLRAVLKIIRPHHWIKNGLVFAPILFGQSISFPHILLATEAWVAISLLASAVYVFNDFVDREADRLHPQKKDRPLAAGSISPLGAMVIMAVLVGMSFAIGFHIHGELYLALYALLNIAYSLRLKRVLILDVMCIAVGFVLRILLGAAVTPLPVSHWIILCTFFGALLLGFGKRSAEVQALASNSKNHRKVLQDYTEDFVRQLLGISSALAIMTYALYTIDPATIVRFGTSNLVYTVLFVMYGIFRYFHLLYNERAGGDPTKIFLKDPLILGTVTLWLISVIFIVKP